MSESTRGRCILALDLGGTTTRLALVSTRGKLLARTAYPTAPNAEPGEALQAITRRARSLLSRAGLNLAQIKGVGLAFPGPVDYGLGVVITSPNLPRWRNVPLRDMLTEIWPIPVFVDNDANAATLGERYFGAGRGLRDFIYLTISTGIGGGLFLRGGLYRGSWGGAGEVGHMILEPGGPLCGCGQSGCLEALASGTALAREARRRLHQREPSVLSKGSPDPLTAREVFAAARQGDPLACDIVQRGASALGMALANLISLLNPQAVVLGGGLSQERELYVEPSARLARRLAFAGMGERVAIKTTELGDNPGLLGAAALVRAGLRRRE